jgi:type IV pilus assembly protein PilA
MKLQRGRSYITILVVIAILVVVGVVAFPWWHNRQIAGNVETALKAADAAKVAVTEAVTVKGGLDRVKASELGYNPDASSSPYIAHIAVADGGRITIVTRDTGAQPDIQLLLTPEHGADNNHAAIQWDCSVSAGDTDQTPPECRNAVQAGQAPATPTTVAPSHSS